MLSDFDEIDRKILKQLQENARISNVDLADHVGLSPAPCLRRVRSARRGRRDSQVRHAARSGRVNLGVTVFVQISLDLQVERPARDLRAARSSSGRKCSSAT